MENSFLITEIAGKKYHMGYTTGSSAAAAAKAAAFMLKEKKKIREITITLPQGIFLTLPVFDVKLGADFASCAVKKDGGDDIDVTTGLFIYAKARYSFKGGVTVTGGEGIGTVTKKGLKVPVGQKAINPFPMEMIKKEVLAVLPQGAEITIWIPKGEETAKKTLNPRLGIIGGLSIIGTTGIVKPMSEESWKESILEELKVVCGEGGKSVCLVFGNMGEEFVKKEFAISRDKIVVMSNFVGYLLDSAFNLGFTSVLIAGHMGKMAKIAGGSFHTHSKMSDGRMAVLCALCALEGAPKAVLAEIYECVTTSAAEEIMEKNHLSAVYHRLAEECEKKCMERTRGEVETGCVLFGENGSLLAKSRNCEKIIQRLKEESQ